MAQRTNGNEPLWTIPFVLILLGCLFLFIPYSLYLPVMPAYLREELHGSLQAAGAINAAFLISAVLFRAQTVRLEARFGVRAVLLVGCVCYMATNLLYLSIRSIAGVLLIRCLSGALFAVVNTSLMALGSRLIPNARKGEGLAYLTTMLLAGGAIGPYLGLTLAHEFGYDAAFIFATLTTILGLVIVYFLPVDQQRDQLPAHLSFFDLFEIKALPVSLVTFLLAISYGGVLTFVVLYATELHFPLVARYFFVVMAGASVLARLTTGRVYDRFGANVAVYSAILVLSTGLTILGAIHTAPGMLAAAALIGTGHGMAVPSIQALAIQLSPAHRTSAVTATFFTCLDGGIGLGSYLLGGGIHAFGYAAVYLALAGATLSCVLFFYLAYTRKQSGGWYGSKEDGSFLDRGQEP